MLAESKFRSKFKSKFTSRFDRGLLMAGTVMASGSRLPHWVTLGASADLDFIGERYSVEGLAPAFTDIPGETSSGGVNGTVVRDGVIVAASAPRIGDDGLLVEGAATNLLTSSGYLFGAGWSGTATEGVADATAPDGSEVFESTPINGVSQRLQTVTLSTSTTYTLSLWLKRTNAGTGFTNITLRDETAGSFLFQQPITWTDAGVASAGTGTNVTAVSIEEFPASWYRISVTGDTGVNASCAVRLYPDAQAGTAATYIWGAQLETGSTATSYIPTEGSSVTRTADSVTLTDLDALGLTSAVLSGGYTVVAEYVQTPAAVGSGLIAQFSDGTVSNRLGIQNLNGTTPRWFKAGGGSAQGAARTAGNTVKHAVRFSDGDFRAAYDGILTTGTSDTLPTVSQLDLGKRETVAEHLNGHIRRLTIIPRAVSDAELQALSS